MVSDTETLSGGAGDAQTQEPPSGAAAPAITPDGGEVATGAAAAPEGASGSEQQRGEDVAARLAEMESRLHKAEVEAKAARVAQAKADKALVEERRGLELREERALAAATATRKAYLDRLLEDGRVDEYRNELAADEARAKADEQRRQEFAAWQQSQEQTFHGEFAATVQRVFPNATDDEYRDALNAATLEAHKEGRSVRYADVFAELQNRTLSAREKELTDLREQSRSLEERLKALENGEAGERVRSAGSPERVNGATAGTKPYKDMTFEERSALSPADRDRLIARSMGG